MRSIKAALSPAVFAVVGILLGACAAAPQSARPERAAAPGAEPGMVEVTGVLTDEGVECRALRGDDGELYTIGRSAEGFEVGERVRVVGSVAEMSFCMQGTTLNVRSIERL